jgi:hypothetical protein
MPETQACVVCGQGSNRDKWIASGPGWVACDHHTFGDIQKALAEKKLPPLTPKTEAKTPSAPTAGTPPSAPSGPTPVPSKADAAAAGASTPGTSASTTVKV